MEVEVTNLAAKAGKGSILLILGLFSLTCLTIPYVCDCVLFEIDWYCLVFIESLDCLHLIRE